MASISSEIFSDLGSDSERNYGSVRLSRSSSLEDSELSKGKLDNEWEKLDKFYNSTYDEISKKLGFIDDKNLRFK